MGWFKRAREIWHSWNAFINRTLETDLRGVGGSTAFGLNPSRTRISYSNERSMMASILTRLGIDASGVVIKHVRLDSEDRYMDDIDSGLQYCLTMCANADQPARQFRQDIYMTLFDKGTAAIVPVDTTLDPSVSTSYDIKTLRVGEIVGWFPQHVRVSLYNEAKGLREQITLPKSMVAIVENPLYSVMNEPNSTLQRLIRKLNMLDAVDEQSSSGKLDVIIQLPYVIKSDARREQAAQRRADIEHQLKGGQYGIAYIDGTEKITQLNRPAENNLLGQVEYLVKLLYSQLGLTPEVMDGTAKEETMINYFNRTIEPLAQAVSEAMAAKFITKTAYTQGQAIAYFKDPFKWVSVKDLAEIADKFIRNEVFSKNEMRGFVGVKPSKDPSADQLTNPNMPQNQPGQPPAQPGQSPDFGQGPPGFGQGLRLVDSPAA